MRAGVGQVTRLEVLTECNGGTISCGQPVSGRVYLDSCYASSSGVYAVGYLFNGSLGQRIHLQAYSPVFRAGILLGDGREGNTTLYASNQATEVGGTAEIVDFALPYTGPYFIFVSPLVAFTFGNYTLGVTCSSSSGNCTPSSTVLCVNNGRFRIEGVYRTPQGQTGPFMATTVASAPDSGLFWFFSASNLEMLIKVLNGCGFNSRYWVFFAAGTNVEFTVTVTDTLSGVSRMYTNALNNPAAPVQDTSAFETCP